MKEQIKILLYAAHWRLYQARDKDESYEIVSSLEDLVDALGEAYNSAEQLESD